MAGWQSALTGRPRRPPSAPLVSSVSLHMDATLVIAGFEKASAALGFEFEPFYSVEVGSNQYLKSVGLVRAFGSARGTVLFGLGSEPPTQLLAQIREAGYFCSMVSSAYEVFDEVLFRDTLNDWGYFGSSDSQPCWYTGGSWK